MIEESLIVLADKIASLNLLKLKEGDKVKIEHPDFGDPFIRKVNNIESCIMIGNISSNLFKKVYLKHAYHIKKL